MKCKCFQAKKNGGVVELLNTGFMDPRITPLPQCSCGVIQTYISLYYYQIDSNNKDPGWRAFHSKLCMHAGFVFVI